ncbi:hypothetical protein BDP27DRAFT_275478 [Rhodocollybia butyracea]|uniref:BTB domain-containing protein n=1 Tax=Rhodocollybia butyracea TaxID=206335 RepID=A0A9P5U0M0_9AGAR|nr:hypothetical protein BDP27DRAFT_275478 [Rhodocollybia butyracea]
MSDNTSLAISKSFQATDADIIVRSADNVSYRLHRKNLELAAGAFPLDQEDLIHHELPESSAALDILFKFIYPQRYVTLDDLDFEALLLLAEAAEKYQIRSAAYGCQAHFRKFVHSNTKDLMVFGAKHDYPSLVLQLAPILVDTPLSKLVGSLQPSVYIAWTLYRDNWVEACKATTILMPEHDCKEWGFYCLRILKQLEQPSHLVSPSHFEALFDVTNPKRMDSCCDRLAEQWKSAVREMLSTLPKVSSMGVKESCVTPQRLNPNDLIELHSSEGHMFIVQPKYLEFFTEGFPPVGTPTDGEKIYLSEPTATLQLLFQFMSPGRYPSLENLDFEAMEVLTEAAEKYVVYPAIYACQFRLREFVETKPHELLSLAGKHNYSWIIVHLAPLLIDTPLSEVVELLPPRYYAPWSVYRDQWLDGLRTVTEKLIKLMDHKCDPFYAFAVDMLNKLNKPSALRAQDLLDGTIPEVTEFVRMHYYTTPPCSDCYMHYDTWKDQVRHTLKAMPKFTI